MWYPKQQLNTGTSPRALSWAEFFTVGVLTRYSETEAQEFNESCIVHSVGKLKSGLSSSQM